MKLEDMEEGKDATGQVWPGQRCKSKRCAGHRMVVGYSVDDEVWAMVAGEHNILCLACFDARAQALGVPYEVTVFGPLRWFEFDEALDAVRWTEPERDLLELLHEHWRHGRDGVFELGAAQRLRALGLVQHASSTGRWILSDAGVWVVEQMRGQDA